jgi:hypothetical protein
MRENRTYGSEGGEAKKPSLPLSVWLGGATFAPLLLLPRSSAPSSPLQ